MNSGKSIEDLGQQQRVYQPIQEEKPLLVKSGAVSKANVDSCAKPEVEVHVNLNLHQQWGPHRR